MAVTKTSPMSSSLDRHPNDAGGLPRSFGLSLAAHAALVLIAFFAASKLVPLEIPSIEPTPFILVREESNTREAASSSSHAITTDPVVKLPPIARPRPPAPVPQPTTTAAPVVTKVSPASTPARVSAPRITIDDFRERHPQLKPAPAAKPRPSVPQIKVEPFDVSPSASQSSNAELSPDQASHFTASLIQRLQEAYVSTGQEDAGLSCRIEFVLRADGRVGPRRILVSSGNRAIDEAVLTALKRVRTQTPPASFTGRPITATFQIVPAR
jgi:TonB family protein